MLDYFELPCEEEPRAMMVWLHGLGADGYDLEPVAEMLGVVGIHHVFPHAPVRPVTINNGMAMRAWYDITAPDLRWQEDSDGMSDSARLVQELIDSLGKASGLPVVLAGFSQGAVVSLVTSVLGSRKVRGVVAMSGYVPEFLSPALASLRDTSVLMMHGEQDEVVPVRLGRAGAEKMDASGIDVVWHSYEMPHSICQQEIMDVGLWLENLLALNQAA